MVRHAESSYTDGDERTRGLTLKGKMDAEVITEILKDEGITHIISSPYARAVLTLEGLAAELGVDIQTIEDLRERHFSGNGESISNEDLMRIVKKSFDEPHYALPGGESGAACQSRSVEALRNILIQYKGKKIAVGTHGYVMASMMNYFDSQYAFEFLIRTRKPDIYRMIFHDLELEEVIRMWQE